MHEQVKQLPQPPPPPIWGVGVVETKLIKNHIFKDLWGECVPPFVLSASKVRLKDLYLKITEPLYTNTKKVLYSIVTKGFKKDPSPGG